MQRSRDDLLTAYRQMRTIREFEERVHVEFSAGDMPGFVHLYAGEEASGVGVCLNLDDRDYIASTHRGHGHCIAKGCDVKTMMAELYGTADGLCGGKGGSMHIADLEKGMMGANGIVGGGPRLTAETLLEAGDGGRTLRVCAAQVEPAEAVGLQALHGPPQQHVVGPQAPPLGPGPADLVGRGAAVPHHHDAGDRPALVHGAADLHHGRVAADPGELAHQRSGRSGIAARRAVVFIGLQQPVQILAVSGELQMQPVSTNSEKRA